jgi:hypothetical protein
MKNNFLYKVWLHNKRLFWVMAVFCLFTIFFNLLGLQAAPFWVWGMYSAKEHPPSGYSFLKTTVNDSLVVDPYAYATTDTRFYLGAPLDYYKKISDNHQQDPTINWLQSKLGSGYDQIRWVEQPLFNAGLQHKDFFNWYARYLKEVLRIDIRTIRVEQVHAHYSKGHLITDRTDLYTTWQQP